MRRHKGCSIAVVGLLAGTALSGGPALADPGSLAALQKSSVVPWTGTITVEWREDRGYCPTWISCTRTESGKLVYIITGIAPDNGSFTTVDWRLYQATAQGSVTRYGRYVGYDGTEESSDTWTVNNDARVAGLRIGSTAPTMSPPSTFVPTPEGETGPFGGFPYDTIGPWPNNDPNELRPINDADPDPNILRGTTVFAAQPNWDDLKAYTYTLSYDLRRGILYKATVKWPRSPWAGATYRTRISVPGNTKKFRPWISTGKARMHVFKRLSLGKYVVEIQAISKSGKKGPALTKAFKVTTAFRVSD